MDRRRTHVQTSVDDTKYLRLILTCRRSSVSPRNNNNIGYNNIWRCKGRQAGLWLPCQPGASLAQVEAMQAQVGAAC